MEIHFLLIQTNHNPHYWPIINPGWLLYHEIKPAWNQVWLLPWFPDVYIQTIFSLKLESHRSHWSHCGLRHTCPLSTLRTCLSSFSAHSALLSSCQKQKKKYRNAVRWCASLIRSLYWLIWLIWIGFLDLWVDLTDLVYLINFIKISQNPISHICRFDEICAQNPISVEQILFPLKNPKYWYQTKLYFKMG